MAGNISINISTLKKCCIHVGPILWGSSSFNEAAKVSTILAITLNVLTMPMTLFLNALIIFVVWKNPSLQVERVIVLAYLALTDFLVGLICQPFLIAREILQLKSIEGNCGLETVFFLAIGLLKGAEFYQIAVISYERYVAIIHPYLYPTRITVKRLIFATIGLWTLNTVVVLLSFLTLALGVSLYLGALSTILKIFISICMVYWYAKIFTVLRRQKRLIGQQNPNVNMNNPHFQRRHKGAMTAVLLPVCLLFSLIPVFVVMISRRVFGHTFQQSLAWLIVQQWAETVAILTALLNTIIYGLATRGVREKSWEALCFRRDSDEVISQNAFVLNPLHILRHMNS
ncbi:olfactory receptor 2M4-like [Actinia tenebrosa]|uniref:Olfactory receptor 2M4-like n=1 Tax=Actinia tenebrosa TaxID=6105 RepID=A0A6P8I885_ACTTE|nr:olfactory receptor 2M4-like [Actinia tenebrosa]